jgi:hypothetical protein
MTHLSREELQRWWEHGHPAERERIVAHLAECDQCGALYGQILDTRPVDGDAQTSAPDLVARARGAYRARRRPGFWSPGRLVAYGAAAALLPAVAIPAFRNAVLPVVGDRHDIRGTSLQALDPVGEITPPVRFRWASPIDAPRYAVEVRDAERRLVFSLPSGPDELSLGTDRLAELEPGRQYTWEAIALTAEGEEMVRSTPQSFSVAPSPR